MIKLAIIGTAKGQKELILTARRMGLYTITFSVGGTTNFSHLSHKHYNISVTDTELISKICQKEKVAGVISTGSDFTVPLANSIAHKLNLTSNDPSIFAKAMNKRYVRQLSEKIKELTPLKHWIYKTGMETPMLPCIVKPVCSAGKVGVMPVFEANNFNDAINFANKITEEIIIEQLVEGTEISVESISYDGTHHIIQTAEALNTGKPHYVEVAHHLPAELSTCVQTKIKNIIPQLLDAINYRNGATDIELIIDNKENVYLIEVNLRGTGGNLSNKLVKLSTGYDYLKGMIEVAIGRFSSIPYLEKKYAGDIYLDKTTTHIFSTLFKCPNKDWLVESTITPDDFNNIGSACYNSELGNYIIYQSNHKITE